MPKLKVPTRWSLVPGIILLFSLACILMPSSSNNPQNAPQAPTEVSPSATPAATPSLTSTQEPVVPVAPGETVNAQASTCDQMDSISVNAGTARNLAYSISCAMECSQSITFKNEHPSMRITLIFFETRRSRPDQGGWTGERWSTEVLAPGESLNKIQYNRTPHADECPWSVTDYSLVGAIPTGPECSWIIDAPDTSLLPLLEVENQCR